MADSRIRARRAQLISTYGVGSLFPAENSSFLVAGLDHWDEDKLPDVPEPRLARQLGVRRLKAPPATPADRNRPSVPVTRFPRVLSCPACNAIGSLRQLRASNRSLVCELCDDHAALIPSRFVTACQAGHLSDFPYYQWAHEMWPSLEWRKDQYPKSDPSKAPADAHVLQLVTRGRTSSLADLVVTCSCGASRSLQDSFNPAAMRMHKCQGERPWLGLSHSEPDCGEYLVTVQRGASNVWFGATTSAISIPPYSGRLTSVVNAEYSFFGGLPREILESARDTGRDPYLKAKIDEYKIDTTVSQLAEHAIITLYPDDAPALTEDEFRFEEFKAIVEGAQDSPDSQFVSESISRPTGAENWVSIVRRIPRLREVRALRGFTRLLAPEQSIDQQATEVAPLRTSDDVSSWLPAVEMLGEGLFIGLDSELVRAWSETPFALDRQKKLQINADTAWNRKPSAARAGNNPPRIDIAHVALHSLGHLLVDQLSLDAGYPASSLRERLYAGTKMAGVLVYTASSDSAGSLGGVAAMTDPSMLGNALAEAEQRLSWCSSDPVCIESAGNGTAGSNLAACHNCILLPESSCEEFNTGLDRAALFGTPERPHDGLISWLRLKNGVEPSTAERQLSPIDADQTTPSDFPKGWAEAWKLFPQLRSVIEILVAEEVVPPSIGKEVGEARIGVDLCWPQDSVALSAGLSNQDIADLEDEAWYAFSVDELTSPDAIADEVLRSLA